MTKQEYKIKCNSTRFYVSDSTCTDGYIKAGFGLTITTGVKTMCDDLKCHWVLDVIGSYLPKLKTDMYFIKVFVRDGTADFYIDDGNYNVKIHQHIGYTDLKVSIQVFLGADKIVCMPSEY